MTDTALRAAASWYATRGLQVLPLHTMQDSERCSCGKIAGDGPGECPSPAKHPITAHGLTDATCDPTSIEHWWTTNPLANVGIRTGPESGCVVIDVDPRHHGYATLSRLFTAHGSFPPTREVKTGGGGSHFFFRYPEGHVIQSRSNALGPGVDVKADGGYVVAPPSLHRSGEHYQWCEPIDTAMAPLPDWVIEELEHGQNGGSKTPLDMAGILDGVTEGQRDSMLFRAASKLRYAGIPIEWAQRLICAAAAECSPPFPERDAIAKVASAYGRYDPSLVEVDSAGDAVQVLSTDSVRVTLASEMGPVEILLTNMEKGHRDLDAELELKLLTPGAAEPYRQRINILSASARESCRRELEAIFGKDVGWTKLLFRAFSKGAEAFLLQDRAVRTDAIAAPQRIEYLIDQFAPANGATIVFGAGSSSKTMLVYYMAVMIANGKEVVGRRCERRRVLVVDYETGEEVFALRINRIIAGLGPSYSADGIFYWDGNGVPLVDQAEAIRLSCDRNGIGAIVVDHAALACGTEPERADAPMRVKRALAKIGRPSILIAHITGDGERDPTQVLRPYGSVFWSNLARQTWYVNRVLGQEEDKAELGLYCRKTNDGRRPSDFGINVFYDGEPGEGPIRVMPADIRKSEVLTAARGQEWKIWQVLEEPMTVAQIVTATGMKLGTVKTHLLGHPTMFINAGPSAGGRGQAALWERRGVWDD